MIILMLIVSSFCQPSEVVIGDNSIFNSSALIPFFQELSKLDSGKASQVSIVHIGDSHIQADFFSGQTRKKLQSRFGNAGRGLVFPYALAGTSGSIDVKVKTLDNWSHCDIMKDYDGCNLGLAGYRLSCNSATRFSIDVKSRAETDARFKSLRVFSSDTFSVADSIVGSVHTVYSDDESRLTFSEYQDSISLVIKSKNDNLGASLQGLVLENQLNGILYNAVGVNGSSTRQYLRAGTFADQIQKLNASLVIISFGTNDCYMSSSKFCIDCVKQRFRVLIERIREQNPSASILLTSPPDSYLYKKYANSNIPKLQVAMKELCFEQNVALWDFYAVMGGKHSIKQWYNNGLARRDYIHLTKEGYILQGDLLYEALVKAYEKQEDV